MEEWFGVSAKAEQQYSSNPHWNWQQILGEMWHCHCLVSIDTDGEQPRGGLSFRGSPQRAARHSRVLSFPPARATTVLSTISQKGEIWCPMALPTSDATWQPKIRKGMVSTQTTLQKRHVPQNQNLRQPRLLSCISQYGQKNEVAPFSLFSKCPITRTLYKLWQTGKQLVRILSFFRIYFVSKAIKTEDWGPRRCEVVLSPHSSILEFQSSFCGPQSSILNPLSSILILRSSLLNPQSRSSIFNPHSTVLTPKSSILYLQSSFYGPQSSILNPRSSILNPRSWILCCQACKLYKRGSQKLSKLDNSKLGSTQ